jgi:lipid-A-disaccharide synthase
MSKGQENSTAISRKIFISAGEQSGDLHASSLINEINKLFTEGEIEFSGLGGEMLKQENVKLLYHINELSTIGFVDVIKKYRFFKKVQKSCVEYIKNNNIDVVVLVDYPGFNLRLAEELRKFYNKKIIYYISPQLWAWHEKRVVKIRKYIDKMLVVFPFETDFYQKFGVDSVYVGNPLVKRIKQFLDENPKEKKIYGEQKIMTILPGSRKDEIKNHLPVLIKTANQLKNEFDIAIHISKASGAGNEAFGIFENELKDFNLSSDNVYKLILNADVVLTKAGTSTLECSLIGTPFAIFYRTFPLNYYLLKPIVKVDRLGIVNILSGEMVIKEFIQNDFTPENLLLEARRILTDEHYKAQLIEKLKRVWNMLGTEDASYNAAKIIVSYLNC